jgi:uncharacterized delta-60 repeat protein
VPEASRRRRSRAARPSAEGLEVRSLLAVGLDPSFGFGGVALLPVPPSSATSAFSGSLTTEALQNGKVVAVGTETTTTSTTSTSSSVLVVTRFNPDGTLDTTFGSSGVQTIPLPSGVQSSSVSAVDVVVQPDSKIDVLGGSVTNSTTSATELLVARVDPNGGLDPTFGTNGVSLTDFSPSPPSPATKVDFNASAMALGPDGRIVVAGFTSTTTSGFVFAIARLNTNGTLDTSLHSAGEPAGLATVAFGLGTSGASDDFANAVVVQPDSKIVVVGTAGLPSTPTVTPTAAAVARLNTDGSLDTSFNGTGKLTYSYNLGGPNGDVANAVILQGTAITIAGFSNVSAPSGTSSFGQTVDDLTVTRLTATGGFDPTFNGSGKFSLPLNRGGIAFSTDGDSLTTLPDGSLMVGGTANSPSGSTALLAKLTTGGALDPTYGASGVAQLPGSFGGRLVVQADGKAVYLSSGGVVRTTAPAPTVVSNSLVVVGRGRRVRATALVLKFNTNLNAALATNPALYRVRAGTRGNRFLKIRSVVYDPTTFSLTLTLRPASAANKGFQVFIAGGGIVEAGGQVLNNGASTIVFIPPPTT